MDRDATYVDPSWEQPSTKPGYLEALGRYVEQFPAELDQFQEDVAENPLGTLKGVGLGALQSVPTPPSKYLKKLQEMPEYEEMSPQAQGGVELGEDLGKAAQAQAINAMVPGGSLLGNVTGSVLSEIPYMADQTPGESMGSMGVDMALSTILGRLAQAPGIKKALAEAVADETGAINIPQPIKEMEYLKRGRYKHDSDEFVKEMTPASALRERPFVSTDYPDVSEWLISDAWNNRNVRGFEGVEKHFDPWIPSIENKMIKMMIEDTPTEDLPLLIGVTDNKSFNKALENAMKGGHKPSPEAGLPSKFYKQDLIIEKMQGYLTDKSRWDIINKGDMKTLLKERPDSKPFVDRYLKEVDDEFPEWRRAEYGVAEDLFPKPIVSVENFDEKYRKFIDDLNRQGYPEEDAYLYAKRYLVEKLPKNDLPLLIGGDYDDELMSMIEKRIKGEDIVFEDL